MFRDLKEYQQIQSIYENRICISDEERNIQKCFYEQKFTNEEFQYILDNLDEVTLIIAKELSEDIQLLHEETLTEQDIQEIVKAIFKSVAKTGLGKQIAKSGGSTLMKGAKAIGKSKALQNVKSGVGQLAGAALRKGKDLVKGAAKFAGGVVKSALPAAGLAGAAVATGVGAKKLMDRKKAIEKQELSQKDPDDPTSSSNTGAPEYKPSNDNTSNNTSTSTSTTTTDSKPKKMGEIERQNRQRLGNKRVDFLKQKQKDFRSMDRAEFRKKYPNSQSAKDAAARKRRPNIMDYSSYTPEGDTINERLGGKGISKKAAKGSIHPPTAEGDGQTPDQDRGAGNKAKKRAGETVEKKTPTFMAYLNKKKEDKKEDKKESFDAYDIVLEYLLSSQQAATIEEANYIMTEMDAKTIQDIVSQQLNEQN